MLYWVAVLSFNTLATSLGDYLARHRGLIGSADAILDAGTSQRGLRLLLRRQYLADQPDHHQLEQIDQARGEYFDEQLFHDRQVTSRR